MKRLIIVLALAALACGQPIITVAPVIADRPAVPIIAIHTQAPLIVVPTPVTVTTLGTLNIRELPDTNSAVLGWYEAGVTVTVLAQVDGIGCPRWYLVMHQSERGYICAEWTSK